MRAILSMILHASVNRALVPDWRFMHVLTTRAHTWFCNNCTTCVLLVETWVEFIGTLQFYLMEHMPPKYVTVFCILATSGIPAALLLMGLILVPE